MNKRLRVVREQWQQLPRRDRQLCGVLGIFLLVVLSVYGLWQPAQQRLAAAQTLYFQRLAQLGELQKAQPTQAATVFDQPLSSRLSESAAAAGLDVQQFEMSAHVLRITLSGQAFAVLGWLSRIEQEGAHFETLNLQRSEQALQAQLHITHSQ